MSTPASNRVHTNSFPASTKAARSSYILPDLQDRGACARFRLRKKTRNGRSFDCISPVDQLQTSVLNLHRKVDHFGEVLLRQAQNLQAAMQAVHATQTMLVAFLEQLSQPPPMPVVLPTPMSSMGPMSDEDSRDDRPSSTLPTQSETVSAPISIIPASPFLSSARHDVTETTPTVSGSSLASTLPGLRGRFQHSGRKNQSTVRAS
jgi:hypothetical protein